MKINIRLNHFDNIVPLEGDAREVVKELPFADRIIMNLPQIAQEFLPDALSKLRVGGTVHMHKIMERTDSDSIVSDIVKSMCASGYKCHLSEKKELKTYSPSASVYVIDLIRD